MLDARCKALVEAGMLQPRSVALIEVTGRVKLDAEGDKFTEPEPGTSVTKQLADLLRDQRQARTWQPEMSGEHPTDPDYPDLTPKQEAENEAEYLTACMQPWPVIAVEPAWDTETGAGSWLQQRLFVGRTGYARLCELQGHAELELDPGLHTGHVRALW
ncbi:hypothetical protein CYMTET_3072 [Cymbomonas tetramitiformis]|uniref:Uncharacterized protein n=1 Tax=Cymbomonas tetramitiformis TaxID=36881 RepID=A0AAE0H424_9CHLO|nr:hypothetical protein CYMTET_39105 [Cymbomonas tetramitiformis]KAK3289507.1 hypothetical protein CYMTET_3072 [Cymbomonas tetramitiformis]